MVRILPRATDQVEKAAPKEGLSSPNTLSREATNLKERKFDFREANASCLGSQSSSYVLFNLMMFDNENVSLIF
jgi:hypothetical protein